MRPIATSTATVLYYQNESKKWTQPDGSEANAMSDEGVARVYLLQDNVVGYRIIAERVRDNKILLDQTIYERLLYKSPNSVFHQWKSENKQVYGLSFTNPEEATAFFENVQRAILEMDTTSQLNAGNIYQDPQVYSQQMKSREPDQESVGSGGQLNYRNQQKSSYSSLQNGHAGAINQTNRRCSQNSASSSSNNIYSTSQQNGQHSNNNSISNIPQVPSAQQMNGQRAAPPPAPPPPPNGVAAVSTKAPPPPPPPPPDFKLSNGNKSLSLADQLKNQQLRKTSGPPVSNGLGVVKNVNETSPPAPQPKPSTTGGHTDLLSELAAKIESRNSTKNCKADTVSTSSSSGVSASDGSDSGGTLIPNSAASNRKFGPNGDGPTTGRTWQKPNGIVTAGITAAANSNGIDSPKANKKFSIDGNSPAITAADLSNLKQEILTEIKQEIAKAKQEIMEAIRIQLSR